MNTTILTFLVLFISMQTIAQEKSKKEIRKEKQAAMIEEITDIVDKGEFIFIPDRANPSGARSINITNHSVRVVGDSIFSQLPYFGRAYNVDYGSQRSPLDFTAIASEFSRKEAKKGYQIEIKVVNGSDNLVYNFRISETGSTTLSVQSTNRRLISYTGEIQKIEPSE